MHKSIKRIDIFFFFFRNRNNKAHNDSSRITKQTIKKAIETAKQERQLDIFQEL